MNMIRMPVSFDPEDKRWLERHAHAQGKSAAMVVREALQAYRLRTRDGDTSFQQLLEKTSGTWKGTEGPLAYQRRLRGEWDHRG